MGVNKFLDRGLALYPDRPFLVDGDVSRTYAQVHDRVCRMAGALQTLGSSDGARCAVYAPNTIAAFESMLSIYRAEQVFVPLNVKNKHAENLHVVTQNDVETLFYDAAYEKQAQALKEQSPTVKRLVCINGPGDAAALDGESYSLERLCEKGPSIDSNINVPNNTLVSIYSTGGTTGMPKGVMFTPLTWEIMAANFFAGVSCTEPPVFLMVPPFTHAAGTLAKILMAAGATIIIQDGFNAENVMGAIEQHGVTHLYLPPTAIYMLLAHPDVKKHDYSSLKCFMYASSPMSVQKLRECIDIFGDSMVQFWGQTEAPIFCTMLSQQDHADALAHHPQRLSSCGRPMLLTAVAVMNEAGELLPAGERGELVVRGNLVMAGYYRNESATADTIRNGWLKTGDVGYRDDDGYYYIVDRIKEMIITGGFNVYPSEVEQALWAHPAVKESAVVGVPDEKWGEAVKAIVQLKEGAELDEQTLIDWCKERVGSVKAPKSIEFWDELPQTAVGKVDKKKIRAQYWADRERAI